MNQEKVGKLIAQKRKEKGLTQEQLADMLGVTNKAVSKWENGKSMPDISIIRELCKILGVSVTTLLNGEEDKEEELVLKLLLVIDKLKKLYWVIVGLVICNIPPVLEELPFIEDVMNGKDFFSGFLNGCFAGVRLVGVMVFAYGLAIYISKEKKETNSEKVNE